MIYTIGHSNLALEDFIKLLKMYNIEVIVDVRSVPYSKFCPGFNREAIKRSLNEVGIKYLFFGKELGARPDDKSCYYGGRVSFDALRKTQLFTNGINRIKDGEAKSCKIAIMCSEKSPLDCHRTILVSRVLCEGGLQVNHIIDAKNTISQTDIEEMLLQKFKLEPSLFDTAESQKDRLAEAYGLQEREIAITVQREEEIDESEF